MCRNIRVLHHFEPPTTPDEIRAAALQYVRKVGGITRPLKEGTSKGAEGTDGAALLAVEEIAAATARLLQALPSRGAPRDRVIEREKGRARWQARASR